MVTTYQNNEIAITISGGLATFPVDGKECSNLLKFADTALYEAKSSGKNNISVYSDLKRRFFRVNFTTELLVRDIKADQSISNICVSSKNVSKSGILFESTHPFKIGSKLELEIPFKGIDECLLIRGTVVRIEVTFSRYLH